MAAGIEAGRLLVWRAAWLKNQGLRNTRETPPREVARHRPRGPVRARRDPGPRRQRLLERVPGGALPAQLEGRGHLRGHEPAPHAHPGRLRARLPRGPAAALRAAAGRRAASARSDDAVAPPPRLRSAERPRRAPGWSERELAALAALAETFVRGDAERRAGLAAEASSGPPIRRSSPSSGWSCARSSRAPSTSRWGRPDGVPRMTPDARERYLLRWAGSRLALRRSAFGAFRKLLTFIAYADPAATEAPNPRLAAIGYGPTIRRCAPSRPRSAAPAAARRSAAGASDAPVILEADVVVVGSGAGGGVDGGRAGEAGPVGARRRGRAVRRTRRRCRATSSTPSAGCTSTTACLSTWDGAITMLAGSGVGGGTLVNWMTCIDAPEARPRGVGARARARRASTGERGRPTSRRSSRELGVARGDPHPAEGRAHPARRPALGWEAAPMRRNATTAATAAGARSAAGAAPSSRASASTSPTRRAAGARIVAGATVTRVLVEGGAAVGVEAELAPAGVRRRRPPDRRARLLVRAPIVVLAAGALRSPAILQASGLEHPAIGRHLRLHPVPVVAGRFDEPVDMWRGTMQAARSIEFSDAGRGPERLRHRVGARPPGAARARPCPGRAPRPMRPIMAGRHLSPLIAITRDGGEGRDDADAGRPRPDRLRARRDRRRDAAARARVDGAARSRGRRRARSSPSARRRAGIARMTAAPATRPAASPRSRTRSRRSTSRPTAAPSPRPTRWAPCGWAPMPRDPPLRPAGPGPRDRAAGTGRPASTSRTARSSRPGSGSTR